MPALVGEQHEGPEHGEQERLGVHVAGEHDDGQCGTEHHRGEQRQPGTTRGARRDRVDREQTQDGDPAGHPEQRVPAADPVRHGADHPGEVVELELEALRGEVRPRAAEHHAGHALERSATSRSTSDPSRLTHNAVDT
jgi:hypothetical protein